MADLAAPGNDLRSSKTYPEEIIIPSFVDIRVAIGVRIVKIDYTTEDGGCDITLSLSKPIDTLKIPGR